MPVKFETVTEITISFYSEDMTTIRKASKSKELSVADFVEDCIIRRSKAIVSKLGE